MPVFSFEARNGAGQPQRGAQEAPSANALVNTLRQRGWLVLKVRPADLEATGPDWGTYLNPFAWLRPRSLDVEHSLHQLAVMLRSGLTLLTGLRTVAEYANRRSMALVWNQVADRIQRGASLADAMAEHRCFGFMVLQLTRVGELTGSLDEVLSRAAEALERRRALRSHILTVLTYPTIVLLAAIGVTTFMIVGVIPKLRVFLDALGRKLPAMTQSLLDVSAFATEQGPRIVGGLVLVVLVVVVLYWWPPGRLALDRYLLRAPILGKMLRLGATVQFSHGLSVLLQSGITLVEGLQTVGRMQNNRFLAERVNEAREAVLKGSSLAQPLAAPGAFLPLLSRMVAVGESAGSLEETLMEVAKFHESQLQRAIRRISTLIEPLIVVVVGGIVGFVYIAFFVGMFSVAGGPR